MTDKVQKIREEVERLKRWNNNVRDSTRHMTLQEEDFNRGKHSSYLEILNFIDSLQEEPVSEDLEEAANNAVIALVPSFGQKNSDGSYVSSFRDCFKREELLELFKAGAQWQKEQMMTEAIEGGCFSYKNGFVHISCDIDEHLTDIKMGDKVKVIVIKED